MRNAEQLTPYERKIGARLTNEQVITEVKQRLYDNLDSIYPELPKGKVVINGYSLGGLFAQTFRFILAYEGKEITAFVKICPMYEGLDPAKMEFETLETVYEKMRSIKAKYAVSRPLVYFQDLNCYVMESVGVKDLRTILLKYNSFFSSDSSISELRGYIGDSAEWLALFHQITASESKKQFSVDEYMGGLTGEFDYRDLSHYSFSASLVNEIEKTIHKLSSVSLFMPLAAWHWDYTPGHVYLDNNKISVIDILGMKDTPIYEDIGHYLASITSINNLPGYPLFNRNRSAYDFCDRFMDSYSSSAKLNKNEFLILANIYRLKYLIVYFLIQNEQVSNRLGSVAGKLFSNVRGVRIFEKPILHALSEISRLSNL